MTRVNGQTVENIVAQSVALTEELRIKTAQLNRVTAQLAAAERERDAARAQLEGAQDALRDVLAELRPCRESRARLVALVRAKSEEHRVWNMHSLVAIVDRAERAEREREEWRSAFEHQVTMTDEKRAWAAAWKRAAKNQFAFAELRFEAIAKFIHAWQPRMESRARLVRAYRAAMMWRREVQAANRETAKVLGEMLQRAREDD